jgi:hypothetical protein
VKAARDSSRIFIILYIICGVTAAHTRPAPHDALHGAHRILLEPMQNPSHVRSHRSPVLHPLRTNLALCAQTIAPRAPLVVMLFFSGGDAPLLPMDKHAP